MSLSSHVSPILCFPVGVQVDQQPVERVEDDEVVDGKMAALGDPIIGIERVIYDDVTGPGAIPARPLTSPKAMTAIQRAIHDLNHLPYDPACEICVSTRRPNTQHRSLSKSDREVPLMVGDYCFPKHSDDADPMTVLVIRVYPYKLLLCCVVPARDVSQLLSIDLFDSLRSVA